MDKELYTDGRYLAINPSWHSEESAWKAQQIRRMLQQHALMPATICEVGCGVGEVLNQLQMTMDPTCEFWGYDISPQAIALCQSRANDRLHFIQGSATDAPEAQYDLLLVLDVMEHVEDYYSFLRELRSKGRHIMLHIPLELSAQTVLRSQGLLRTQAAYGHLHYFTRETALQALANAGYTVVDAVYTRRALEEPTRELPRWLLHYPRALLFAVNEHLAARLLGGFSLLVLATTDTTTDEWPGQKERSTASPRHANRLHIRPLLAILAGLTVLLAITALSARAVRRIFTRRHWVE